MRAKRHASRTIRRRASHAAEPRLRVGDRGDANRNATVAVEFRAVGRIRLAAGAAAGADRRREASTGERENLDYTVPDGFAGSILNLQPGTEYECRFRLTDPDGASGADHAHRQGEDAHRAAAFARGPHAARLPAGLSRASARNPASPASCRPTTARGWATGASSGSAGRSRATRSWCMPASTSPSG